MHDPSERRFTHLHGSATVRRARLPSMWGSRRRRRSEARASAGDDALQYVHVKLWREDAIVLYDWLMSGDLNAVPITHRAQKQALVDLLDRLEQDTDVEGVTGEEIAQAQDVVGKDTEW